MAKKRKSTKKKSGKRRRVGGIGGLNLNSPAVKLLGVAAGYFLGADFVNEGIDSVLAKKGAPDATGTPVPMPLSESTKTIVALGQVGVGGLLLMKKRQNFLTFAAGSVAAGAGVKRALKKFGVIKGYQSVPVIGRHRMAGGGLGGYQSVPVIGVTPPQLAGTPAQLQGYTPAGSGVGAYNSQGSGVMGSTINPNANGSGLMSGTGYLG